MDYLLENNYLTINVSNLGAQLQSIRRKDNAIEYLYQGHPSFWAWQAPILFPHVGKLKDDCYFYEGKSYPSKQHGFARWQTFELLQLSAHEISFILSANSESKKSYPFDFNLIVSYLLQDEKLLVTYKVKNPSLKSLYFSIGGHPAFNLPLTSGRTFEDYRLQFEGNPSATQYTLDGPFLDLDKRKQVLLKNFPLTHDLFKNDALIYEAERPINLTLTDVDGEHGVRFHTGDFPYLGIWTKFHPAAPFLSLEAWTGMTDSKDTSQNLPDKFAITHLAAGQEWIGSYSISVF
ncbi:aldose 1-epimerase family protein [Atopobacter sp. AH10]|uniref:aldose 1-epimerase family protein n=1 Tax=Atopobacter sp. AH10 TaxID=2315861 RepID=UPI000EF28AB7|nr:aldose 1-epimerase family protein [Atopobacter sp. AH10]RLK63505.1 aldose 1-epimerase family protein [Atopobacter sp. AH10]